MTIIPPHEVKRSLSSLVLDPPRRRSLKYARAPQFARSRLLNADDFRSSTTLMRGNGLEQCLYRVPARRASSAALKSP